MHVSEYLRMTISKTEIPSGYHYACPAVPFIQSLKLGILESIFFCFFFFFFFLPFACPLLVTKLFTLCFLKTSWIQPLLIFLSYSQSSGSLQALLRLRHTGFLKNMFSRGNNRCKYQYSEVSVGGRWCSIDRKLKIILLRIGALSVSFNNLPSLCLRLLD